jgi:hypothetical protein
MEQSSSDNTTRYYEEVLRMLGEIHSMLKENNEILKQDHSVNRGIFENVRKLRFNTQ